MPATVAKVHISFGLVSIPVTVFSATEQHAVPLHQVHAKDGARIRMRRFCEAEGAEVPYHEVVRGTRPRTGAPWCSPRRISPTCRCPPPSRSRCSPSLPPPTSTPSPTTSRGADGAAASRPYVLLRDALVESGQVVICRVALRTREALAVLHVRDDVLVLHTLLWPDEIRPTAGIAPAALGPAAPGVADGPLPDAGHQ